MLKVLPVLMVLAYPLLVYAGIALDDARFGLAALILLAAAAMFKPLIAGRALAWLALAGFIGAFYLITQLGGGMVALYLPSIVIPALMVWVFGSTLLPGRQALIERIAEQTRDSFPPDLRAYTRRLTMVWTGFLVLIFLSSLIGALSGSPQLWSILNIINYSALGLMFPLEFIYRGWRFRHLPHPGFMDYLRIVRRVGIRKS